MRNRLALTIAAVFLLAAGCSSSAADPTASAPTPSDGPGATDAASTPATSRAVERALDVNDAYFAAYEDGDVNAMMELFAPDPVIQKAGPWTVDEWRRLHEWKLTEGTVMLPRECTANEPGDRDEVDVRCEYAQHEYAAIAVDGPPVAHTMTMLVGDDGITFLDDAFGQPDFGAVGAPFDAWVRAHHPEDADAYGCCEWDSVEDAQQSGALSAELSDKWVAWLDDNPSCSWRDLGCQTEGARPSSETPSG